MQRIIEALRIAVLLFIYGFGLFALGQMMFTKPHAQRDIGDTPCAPHAHWRWTGILDGEPFELVCMRDMDLPAD